MEKDNLCSDLNDFTFSDNYIDDINNISKTSNMNSIILMEIFTHHQSKQKDTASFKNLFFDIFNELDSNYFRDLLSIETMDILSERMFNNKENNFILDDNIKSILSECFYYYAHNFEGDWGDRTGHCKNDIELFINKIPEFQTLYISSLKLR